MSTHTFSSPEAYVAGIGNANLRTSLILRKSRVPWMFSSVDLPDLRLQWGQGGGCTLTEGAVVRDGGVILFPTHNAQAMRMNGRQFDAQTFRLQMQGDELSLASTEPHRWFSISIPGALLAEWSRTGTTAKALSSRFYQIPDDRAEMLRRAVVQLGSIVERAPDALTASAVARTTARKLTDLVREAIWGLPSEETSLGRQSISRSQIVRMVMDSIDGQGGEFVTVPDLASAAGVSERTLRAAFHEYFGIGPVQFLRLRTLNQVRAALRNSDPALTTVTEVATRFGVWELGRLARDYRLLFGELPSATLRSAH
jgi:AraC family ethanolamine operon transcriptional activator